MSNVFAQVSQVIIQSHVSDNHTQFISREADNKGLLMEVNRGYVSSQKLAETLNIPHSTLVRKMKRYNVRPFTHSAAFNSKGKPCRLYLLDTAEAAELVGFFKH